MAVQTEMYSPVGASIVLQQPVRQSTGLVTWWDRVIHAARIRFGVDILIHNKAALRRSLAKFIEDLLFTVVDSEPEPLMARQTLIDVTFKEFVNLGERENDKTVIKVGKNLPLATGNRYHFTMNEGVKFDHKYNFGAQIVGISMAGGYMSVGTSYTVKEQSYNTNVKFSYDQKEKIVVPPKTKVKAKIITSTRKLRQKYTLEFSAPRTSFITVEYYSSTQDQLNLCGCCNPTVGYLYASDIMQTLPNFKVTADGFSCFTQSGTLNWIGEVFTVEKSEEPL